MRYDRVYNFSAGPAMMPESVLEEIAAEVLNYHGSGMSVMEMSHRSPVFQEILSQAEADLRTLMHIPDNYKVLFVQGGGTVQFAMVPMNLMKNGVACYVETGAWSKKAIAEAKRYGVVYCALRGKERSADGMVDIMVRAEDASKINRIVERFKLATVDTVSIKRDIEQSKADKTASSAPEQEKPDKAADDRLLDDLLGAPVQKEEHASPNPAAAKTEKSRPSAPTSEKQSRTAEGTAKSPEERPSVREELREIRESRQKEAAEPGISEPTPAKEPKKQQTTTHKQPSRKKPKKAKER